MNILGHVGEAWSRFRDLLRVTRADPLLRQLFIVVLAIDLGWIVWFAFTRLLHLSEVTSYYHKQLKHLLITTEGGYPEIFNYAKTLALVLLLASLAWSNRRLIYVALTVVFTVILLDDSLAIHENFGAYLVWRFDIPKALGLRAQDFGELIIWAILGALLVPLIVAGIVRARPPHRGNGLALLVPFTVLLFCAVGVDQLYGSFGYSFFGASIILDSLEDGGEMIAITTCCAVAAALVRHGPDTTARFAPAAEDERTSSGGR